MNVSTLSAGGSISSAFSWWIGELKALFGPLQLKRTAPELLLTQSDDQWVARLRKGTRIRELARLESGSRPAAIRKATRSIAKHIKLKDADVTVLLPQSSALRRPLEMPAVAEPDLRRALSFEIDRQTPFEANDVFFDYRVLTRDPATKKLVVELITIPKSKVDAVLSEIKAWGLNPLRIDIESGSGGDGLGINLLEVPDNARSRYLNTAMYLLLLALLFSALAIPVWQLGKLDRALESRLAKEKEAANKTLEMRDDLAKEVKSAQFLDVRKQSETSSLLILNTLTDVLPDDTWLMSYQQSGHEIKISGYSTSAAQLISVLDNADLFTGPKFTSSIVQDKRQQLERFEIMFEVENTTESMSE